MTLLKVLLFSLTALPYAMGVTIALMIGVEVIDWIYKKYWV